MQTRSQATEVSKARWCAFELHFKFWDWLKDSIECAFCSDQVDGPKRGRAQSSMPSTPETSVKCTLGWFVELLHSVKFAPKSAAPSEKAESIERFLGRLRIPAMAFEAFEVKRFAVVRQPEIGSSCL